jgi:hypothetical protein
MLGQKQVRANCNNLISKIVSNNSCQLWPLSADHNEFNNFHHMLDGSLKTTDTTEKINLCLLAEQSEYFRSKNYHIIVHDPSTICKPESSKSEYLCQIKDLDNSIVNGYMTYNCVAVDLKTSPIHLLRCIPYSTEQPEYVTQEELLLIAGGKLGDREREKQIKELERQGKTINLRTITFDAAKTISQQIHSDNPAAVVIDVYDRGFDYYQLFEFETLIGNLFVVRSKLNCNSNELKINENGKEKAIKLKNQISNVSF